VQHSASLSWTASTSPNVTGYNIYRSTTSGTGYVLINTSPISGVTYTDSTVSASTTYYYVATALNSSGVESTTYSNQATAVIP
jgi:fibronectin type 3 domain-containing protein